MEKFDLGSNNPDEIVKKLEEIRNIIENNGSNDNTNQSNTNDSFSNKIFEGIKNYKKIFNKGSKDTLKNIQITSPFLFVASNIKNIEKLNQQKSSSKKTQEETGSNNTQEETTTTSVFLIKNLL